MDRSVQDLPHTSSTLEWWYVNGHARTLSGRDVALFASFFRTAVGRDEQTNERVYAHALTWAVIEPEQGRYLRESLVDQQAPRIVHEQVRRGEGVADPMLRRALGEVVARGTLPGPDVVLSAPCRVGTRRLRLDFDGRTLESLADDGYALRLRSADGLTGCDLRLQIDKPLVEHGDGGLVQGKSGEQMFYYFTPRCSLHGSITIDGRAEEIVDGTAWYDHEFGHSSQSAAEAGPDHAGSISWDWLSVQLDNNWDLTLFCLFDDRDGHPCGRHAILIDPAGRAQRYEDFRFEGFRPWTSTKTFVTYPTAWEVRIPHADLALEVEAAFPAQEFVTMISRPAF